jgi:hypothetical protein
LVFAQTVSPKKKADLGVVQSAAKVSMVSVGGKNGSRARRLPALRKFPSMLFELLAAPWSLFIRGSSVADDAEGDENNGMPINAIRARSIPMRVIELTLMR